MNAYKTAHSKRDYIMGALALMLIMASHASAFVTAYKIGDYVWHDLNGDGIQDVGEPGVPDVQVSAHNANGVLIGESTTDAGGHYSIDWHLTPFEIVTRQNNAYVQFVVPSGYIFTTQNQGIDDNVDSDADVLTGTTGTKLVNGKNNTFDAGLVSIESYTIGDYVWHDINRDGTQNDGPSGLVGVEGVTVDAYTALNTPMGTATTDAFGWYEIMLTGPSNVGPAPFYLTFTLPDGSPYTFTGKDVGDDTLDSDVDPDTGQTALFSWPDPEEHEIIDFDAGLVFCLLGDRVWHDLNGDGIQDSGEPGVPGVKAFVYDADHTYMGESTTDADGYYAVEVPCNREYYVKFVVSFGGFVFTAQDRGTDDTTDSDVDAITGKTGTLPVVGDNDTFDAGLVTPPPCGECEGKVTLLELGYLGGLGDSIKVTVVEKEKKNFEDIKDDDIILEQTVQTNGTITLIGFDKKGTLGTKIALYVNEIFYAEVHTSCSQEIGPGLLIGDDNNFMVVDGESLEGGALCPVDQPSTGPCDCEGKVAQLTMQYKGDGAQSIKIYQKKEDVPVFDSSSEYPAGVPHGVIFTIYGQDDKGTLGTEISIDVDDALNTKIHTSCSKPIGPGLVSGDFEVISGVSGEGTVLCPVINEPSDECGCEGKVIQLTLQYNGDCDAVISVEQKDGVEVFSEKVASGGEFTFSGQDKNGTLGTEISVLVDGVLNTKIHTSCSKPIGPGLISGDFEVVGGVSGEGSVLCEVINEPSDECGCEGKVSELTLQYNGNCKAAIRVEQKDGDDVFLDVVPGGIFTLIGQDKKGTLGTEISVYVNNGLNTKIHTSCSKPIGPGLISGDFEVVSGFSREGGELCAVQ